MNNTMMLTCEICKSITSHYPSKVNNHGVKWACSVCKHKQSKFRGYDGLKEWKEMEDEWELDSDQTINKIGTFSSEITKFTSKKNRGRI